MARKKGSRKGKRSFAKSTMNITGVLIGGGLYGYGREFVSDKLAPVTAKVPLGNIADEAVLFGLSAYLRKKISNPTVKNVLLAGMFVESARMGQAAKDGALNLNTSNSGASSNNFIQSFG